MVTKTYRVKSVQDGVAKAKVDFDGKPTLVENRRETVGGVFGVGGEQVYVMRFTDDAHSPSDSVKLAKRTVAPNNFLESKYKKPAEASGESLNPNLNALTNELSQMKMMMGEIISQVKHKGIPDVSDELIEEYIRLVENEVADGLAQALVRHIAKALKGEELNDRMLIRKTLVDYVSRLVKSVRGITFREDGQPTVVALIGPPGVGKTTTVAKLATQFSHKEGKAVGLISTDECRLGASSQLKTYAQLAGVPVCLVSSASEMPDALATFADKDLILLDTAGVSVNDNSKVDELQEILDSASPDEVHLVLNATASSSYLERNLEQFGHINVHRLITTKIDEATNLGLILNVLAKADNRMLSYMTTGQDIPQDIEIGDARRLARLVIGEERVSGR